MAVVLNTKRLDDRVRLIADFPDRGREPHSSGGYPVSAGGPYLLCFTRRSLPGARAADSTKHKSKNYEDN